MKTLLIDGDLLAYQTAAGQEEETDWGDGIHSLTIDVEYACETMRETIQRWVDKLDADEVVTCLSDEDRDFRQTLHAPYKESRSGKRKPMGLMKLKGWLEDSFKSYRKDWLEADDVMGILSTHPHLIPGIKIIVSEDKDMKTIPGWLYNPRKDDEPRLIHSDEADYWHLYQTLVGDATDGYAGCPGIGPKRAEKILTQQTDDPEIGYSLWARVVRAFEKAGLTEEDALIQARMARILRYTDYDFKKKEPKLWTPPSR